MVSEAKVCKVEMIHGSSAYVYFARREGPDRQVMTMTKVYRKTWGVAYWPPGVGDIFDAACGTLRLRPRSPHVPE